MAKRKVPPKLPKVISKNQFKCKHCKIRFRTRQALGGHTSKKHAGLSTTFAYQMIRRAERVNERYVHRLAKEIYHGLQQNTLDQQTLRTFKWQRKRLTLHERAVLLGESKDVLDEQTIKQIKESDKGRVRKIKVKVWAVLRRPHSLQRHLLGPDWLEKF